MVVSTNERLIAHVEGAVGWLIFNNPRSRNSVTVDMWEAIPGVIANFDRDPAIRVIVLRGCDTQAFASGADISEFEKQFSSPTAIDRYNALVDDALYGLGAVRKPTIAMIHGYCIGGGLAIALACDMRIAARTARLGIPAARLGLSYSWRGIQTLMQIVGPAYTKEIMMTARYLSAEEAHTMGLVNQVVAESELEEDVRSHCVQIANNAPLAIEAIKGIVAELVKSAADVDHERCERLIAGCFQSRDYIEGRRAFLEKRKPIFTGS